MKYIYAFSRGFYPKRLTVYSGCTFFIIMCVPWELNPQPIALLTHYVLLQNVTIHVGIHVSLNEPQLPSTSSSHAAPDHDATTTMLDCRQGTVFVYSSPGHRHTCWTPSESNKFTLDSSDHRTWFQ